MSEIKVLPQYTKVLELIDEKAPCIFVTGGAGTGKSTLIDWLSKELDGKVLLSATTGIAAINIGGKTIHSLFRFPPTYITKDDIQSVRNSGIFFSAKCIIIDEVSMMTANQLDSIDRFLQLNCRSRKPFGGKTVILVGDLFQLPPVFDTSDELKNLNKRFFEADVLNTVRFSFIELSVTYRQHDAKFIEALTNIRTGTNIVEAIDYINTNAKIVDVPDEESIIVSPRNKEVDDRNNHELRKLKTPQFSYDGVIEGDFKSSRCPSPYFLDLKVGAQVMFTKNDSEGMYVNGSIGTVTECNDCYINVKSDGRNITLNKAEWIEFKYTSKGGLIVKDEVGSYNQYPLSLAWASTVHKIQGKSLDKVHYDIGVGSFATGQTYVALSRARTIQGLSLSRKLEPKDVIVDNAMLQFYDFARTEHAM